MLPQRVGEGALLPGVTLCIESRCWRQWELVRVHTAGLFWLCKHTDTPFTHSQATPPPPRDLSTVTLHGDTVLPLPGISSEPTTASRCPMAQLGHPASPPGQDAISQGVPRTPLCPPGTADGLWGGAHRTLVKAVHREEGAVTLFWVSLRISGSTQWEPILPSAMPKLHIGKRGRGNGTHHAMGTAASCSAPMGMRLCR